jgi:hypothetical protein
MEEDRNPEYAEDDVHEDEVGDVFADIAYWRRLLEAARQDVTEIQTALRQSRQPLV